MGNVIQAGETRSQQTETLTHNSSPEQFVEDYTPRTSRHQSGEEKRVRFQNIDTAPHNVVLVKANENRSSASSSGYESKSCSSMDSSDADNAREPVSAESPVHLNPAIEDILTCDECGQKFSKSGHYLSHIRTRTHSGCNLDNIDETSVQKRGSTERCSSPKSLVKVQADAIRKTKSYNQERDLLWIPPDKLRPKSARPEHRILGPLGNSYLHWLTHLERLDQLSDESSETDGRSPPSTGESTLC